MQVPWLAVLCVLAGCDYTFNLDHIGPARDGGPDGAPMFLDAPEPCPTSYKVVADTPVASRYRIVTVLQTWEVAEADCVNDSITGITHLAVFDDPTEMPALRAEINASIANPFDAFAGYAHDTGADPRQFFAVTGEALANTVPPWNLGEPNGGTGTDEEPIVWFGSNHDFYDGGYFYQEMAVCECDHRRATRTFTVH
jgi:hypothetical protein